jgi:hypothetical protein
MGHQSGEDSVLIIVEGHPFAAAVSVERVSDLEDLPYSINSVPRMRPDDRCGSQLEGVGYAIARVQTH